jgi:hypothetical protein
MLIFVKYRKVIKNIPSEFFVRLGHPGMGAPKARHYFTLFRIPSQVPYGLRREKTKKEEQNQRSKQGWLKSQ